MDQQIVPTAKATIEEVRKRFEQWRKSRKHCTPIPAGLWEEAVGLCADHSISKITRSLRLNYNALKRRIHYFHPESFCESVPSSPLLSWI